MLLDLYYYLLQLNKEMFLLYFLPPGGGLVFEVRITKPKPSLSLRCRVTSKHSGREGWRGWTASGTSTRGTLGEVLTRADATCWGCWLLSSGPSPSDKWQWTWKHVLIWTSSFWTGYKILSLWVHWLKKERVTIQHFQRQDNKSVYFQRGSVWFSCHRFESVNSLSA